MVKISDSWNCDPRKKQFDTDMQLSELSVLYLVPGEPVWLCADNPPMMHGEDSSGMWIGLSVEEPWALVDRLQAELPDRDSGAEPASSSAVARYGAMLQTLMDEPPLSSGPSGLGRLRRRQRGAQRCRVIRRRRRARSRCLTRG